jgi:hypothetical protein
MPGRGRGLTLGLEILVANLQFPVKAAIWISKRCSVKSDVSAYKAPSTPYSTFSIALRRAIQLLTTSKPIVLLVTFSYVDVAGWNLLSSTNKT